MLSPEVRKGSLRKKGKANAPFFFVFGTGKRGKKRQGKKGEEKRVKQRNGTLDAV